MPLSETTASAASLDLPSGNDSRTLSIFQQEVENSGITKEPSQASYDSYAQALSNSLSNATVTPGITNPDGTVSVDPNHDHPYSLS